MNLQVNVMFSEILTVNFAMVNAQVRVFTLKKQKNGMMQKM